MDAIAQILQPVDQLAAGKQFLIEEKRERLRHGRSLADWGKNCKSAVAPDQFRSAATSRTLPFRRTSKQDGGRPKHYRPGLRRARTCGRATIWLDKPLARGNRDDPSDRQ